MEVCILTEGGYDIGFGHVVRCMSLYQAFEEKGITPEFVVYGDDTIKEFLEGKKYSISEWIYGNQKILSILEKKDIVIIDSILADCEIINRIATVVKLPVYLDDWKKIKYTKGIIVDWTIFAEENNLNKGGKVVRLLGNKFVALRKEFWHTSEKHVKEKVDSIMVMFGGGDVNNMTPKVLGALKDNYPHLHKKIIIGKAFQNIQDIKKLADDKIDLIYYPDANKIIEIMLDSDVAISSGGQTLYELARIGVPTIAVAVVDNQMEDIRGWHKTGFIEYAGWWEEKEVIEKILFYLSKLMDYDSRLEKSKIGKSFVDGKGAIRIVEEVIRIYNQN